MTLTSILLAVVAPIMPRLMPGGAPRGPALRLLKSPKPLETDLGPLRTQVTDSPCRDLSPVVSHLRLVEDDGSKNTDLYLNEKNGSDASADLSDADAYWDRLDELKTAGTRAFAKWMRDHQIYGDLSLRELMSAYGEFCWTFDLKPLSERCLQNRLKASGFATSRPPGKIVDGKLHRPTKYRVKPAAKRAA